MMRLPSRHPALQVAALAALGLLACNEGSTGPKPVASVQVSPSSVTLAAGQTTPMAGTARDADGRALSDRQLTWQSGNTAFVTVSASGTLTGVAEGTTQVTATAEGVSGSATVNVLPPAVATVTVQPAQISLLPGETATLSATAISAQGAPLSGRIFTWLSNDASVATVDQNGVVSSVAPGSATIFATSGGRSGSAAVGVDDPDAPRVTSITPTVLVEGQPATLDGTNFSAVPAENVVTVDGFRATVTAASATSLEVVVPLLGCRPRHPASVAVTVGARTGRSSFPARPASFFQLAQGQLLLLEDPATHCLQFDAAAAEEEYLIGIQSTASDPRSLTYAALTGEKDPAAPPATTSPRPLRLPSLTPQITLGATDLWERELRAREAEVMAREVEMARDMRAFVAQLGPQRSAPTRIPGTVTVGTAVTVKYPDLDSSDRCNDFIQIDGTVEFVGSSSIWIRDNNNPLGDYSRSQYTTLGNQFEADIYSTQTSYFGAPSDADQNGRVIVVVTKEVNADGIGGIVPTVNLPFYAACPASNNGEYFFMISPDPGGQYAAGSITASAAANLAPAIGGHELVHNIHLSRRDAAGLSFWDSWAHEGQATLGEEILGHALTPGRGPGQNYGWTVIRNEPPDDIASRRWYYDSFSQLFRYYGWSGDGNPTISTDEGSTKRANAPEGCTWLDGPGGNNAGLCADRGLLVYGVTWAFLRWLTDHYAAGLGGEAAMHTAWIDGAPSGFASIEALVGENIETLLARWAASLYLDDRVGGLDPFLTVPSWDLDDIDRNLAPEARLEPRFRGFDDFTQGVQVRAGSSAYFLVGGANRPSTALKVRGLGGGFLGPTMQVWVVRVR